MERGVRPASPGYVYLPGVPSESNREQEVSRLIFYRRFPEFSETRFWLTAKMVMQLSALRRQQPPPLPSRLSYAESRTPIFTFRFPA